MKKRKFLSVIAILFVAIFALSVCFFAACKSKEVEETEPEDVVDDDNDGNDGTGTGRNGSPLTGDEDIIGSWSGETEIRASAYGFGGTIEAEMNVEITATEFTLAFTPSQIDIDEIIIGETDYGSMVSAVLDSVGIKENTEFVMFPSEAVYVDKDGYYADINGDYVTCQLPLTLINENSLSISFNKALNFGIDVDIVFDATLDRVALPAESYVINVATSEDSEQYLTTTVGENTVTFVNDDDLKIVSYQEGSYIVNGTSSEMTADMAAWFGNANEGDQYVVIKITVKDGETVSYTSNGGTENKSYTNTDDDDHFDDGYFFVVYKLTFDEDGVCTSKGEYTVTDESGAQTVYTVSFSGVTVLRGIVTLDVESATIRMSADTLSLSASAVMSDGKKYSGGYSWTSSDETVATVSVPYPRISPQNATVTPVGVGETTIKVTLDDGESATCVVTVTEAPTVESVTLSPATGIIEVGDTATITADIVMSDGSEYPWDYTWTSSDTSVATVKAVTEGNILSSTTTNRATVTAVKEGTTTITLTLEGNKSATCTITVVDPLVAVYEGDGVGLGDSASATFKNDNGIAVTVVMNDQGGIDYEVSGAATVMTEEQITAYNAAYATDTASTGDAFVVMEIKAAAGSTISYGGQTFTLGADETSAVIVQKIAADKTSRVQSVDVTITGTDSTTESFTITFGGVVIPDNAIVGTWTAETINASAGVTMIVDLGTYDATASAEMVVKDDGTFTVSITNIEALGIDFSDYLEDGGITLSGTWVGGEGVYTMTGSAGNVVTVIMTDEQTVEISFEMTYDISVISIDISVEDAVLTIASEGAEI